MSRKGKKPGKKKKKACNLRYINERRHQKSHVKRISKHLEVHPNDRIALDALKKYKAAA